MTKRATVETSERFLSRLLGGDFLLWSPNIQAEAFLNWDKIWATRTIKRGVPKPFARASAPLDITFESKGTTRTIDELIRQEFMSGLIVVKNQKIHLERYAMGLTPNHCWQGSSMVKSLTSMLVGAALHDGAIDNIQQRIATYLPELMGTPYEEVTIRHLLQMASGVGWVENTDDRNSDVNEHYIKPIAARRSGYILEYLKARPRVDRPGSQFYYNSGDTFLLSHIISRTTRMTVAEYCSKTLWQPMGCEQDGYFMLDTDNGHEVTGSCCGATLRDYAKWGLFMLGDGIIDGRRVLPVGWVAESITATAPNFVFNRDGRRGGSPDPSSGYSGYGYLWWVRGNGDYVARGAFGQMIYVSPDNDAIIAILSAVPRQDYMSEGERALHKGTSHSGSEMRYDFIARALDVLR